MAQGIKGVAPKSIQKLDKKLEMAEKKARGATTKELAMEYGVSTARISKILADQNIQEFIEEITRAMTFNEGLKAYKNVAYAIDSYQKTKDPQLRSEGFKASLELMRSIGVLESKNVSVSIQNITNTQNNIVSPMMQELIQKHLGLKETKVIDVKED